MLQAKPGRTRLTFLEAVPKPDPGFGTTSNSSGLLDAKRLLGGSFGSVTGLLDEVVSLPGGLCCALSAGARLRNRLLLLFGRHRSSLRLQRVDSILGGLCRIS